MKNGIMQCVVVVASLSFSALACSVPVKQPVSFKNDVTPIIHDYCLSCHQPGGKGYETSGLDMSSYDGLMKGTKYGSIVKPGDSFTSVLIQVVDGRVHASIKMPYGMSGGLSNANIGVLKKWIDQGAKND